MSIFILGLERERIGQFCDQHALPRKAVYAITSLESVTHFVGEAVGTYVVVLREVPAARPTWLKRIVYAAEANQQLVVYEHADGTLHRAPQPVPQPRSILE